MTAKGEGLDVSRETLDRLRCIEGLVQKWNRTINLISKNTVDQIWQRHICDSIQIYRYAPPDFKTWLDIGSGGGFPGLIVAAVAPEKNPSAKVTLMESDARKVAFLRTAIRECDLSAAVIENRIETAPPQSADVVSARALGPLKSLLSYALRHGHTQTTCIFPKGQRFQEEITTARQDFRFDVVAHQSITDKDARILVVRNISRERAN